MRARKLLDEMSNHFSLLVNSDIELSDLFNNKHTQIEIYPKGLF